MITKILAKLPLLFSTLLIFVLFWIVAKLISHFIKKISHKQPLQRQPLFDILSSSSYVAILIIGLISALGSAGMNVSALVASFSLSGFAISFATKDAFSNLCAGILLLLYQPFKIGDVIEVNNFSGRIVKMSLRYTHLVNANKEILVPNSSLLTNNIIIMRNNQ